MDHLNMSLIFLAFRTSLNTSPVSAIDRRTVSDMSYFPRIRIDIDCKLDGKHGKDLVGKDD